MAYRDLAHFLRVLESKQLLKRIRVPVSRDLEISEITDRVVKAGGPALLFEKVEGCSVPVLINTFGTEARMALALEVSRLSDLSRKMEELLGLALNPPSGRLMDKLRLIPKLVELARFPPKRVGDGPCKEVVKKQEASLEELPIMTCWPGDGGRFITFPLVFSHDPETGKRNCGIYRMQVYDARTTGMHSHRHKDAARHFRKGRQRGERVEVAVAIGPDPAVTFSGAVPLPPDMDEMLLAGFLRGESVKMVRAETVDVEIPANAQIVIEGTVDPADLRPEGPFGDHTGFYSLQDLYPTFHVTAITHCKEPLYQSIIVGPPVQEDCFMGQAIERLFLPLLRMELPEVVDYHMPFEGGFHNLLIVSIDKQYPGQARKVMHALWGMGQAMFTKVLVVVDRGVDVHDAREVVWKALAQIDPERDMEVAHGPVDVLDHAAPRPTFGSKVGFDATAKLPEEGARGAWPEELVMSPEIKALVEKKWSALGL